MTRLSHSAISLFFTACAVLMLEGAYSLYKGKDRNDSITGQLITAIRWRTFDHAPEVTVSATSSESSVDNEEMPDANRYHPDAYPVAILPERYIQNWEHLRAWVPILTAAGYTIGGDVNKVIDDENAIQRQKYLWEKEIIEHLDPVTNAKIGLEPKRRLNGVIQGFFDNIWVQPQLYGPRPEGKPSNAAQYFIDHYVTRMVPITITEEGYRLTVPEVKSDRMILVIGDSMVYGARMGDDTTLPSYLQRLYPEYRVINSGIPSSQADDNYIRLKRLLAKYKGNVAGVIYLHYENDLNSRIRAGVLLEPKQAVFPVKQLLDSEGIRHSLYIAHPSVYISNTDIVRPLPEQYRQIVEPFDAVVKLAREAGFKVIDGRDVVYAFRSKNDSVWAGLGFYCDWAHMSPLGNQFLAQTIYDSQWLAQ